MHTREIMVLIWGTSKLNSIKHAKEREWADWMLDNNILEIPTIEVKLVEIFFVIKPTNFY